MVLKLPVQLTQGEESHNASGPCLCRENGMRNRVLQIEQVALHVGFVPPPNLRTELTAVLTYYHVFPIRIRPFQIWSHFRIASACIGNSVTLLEY